MIKKFPEKRNKICLLLLNVFVIILTALLVP